MLLIAAVLGVLFGADRNAYAKITPDGREDTQYFFENSPQRVTNKQGKEIIFNCDRPFDDIPTYLSLGYNYVTVSLEFQMREIDDGYQNIYLYSGVNGLEVYSVKLDYYGDYKIDAYHTVVVNFMTLPLREFAPNNVMNLCLKFGASGWGGNTWEFKDVKVTVELSKTIARDFTYTIDYS